MVSPIGSFDQSDLTLPRMNNNYQITNPMNYNYQTANSNTGRSQPQNQAQHSLPPLNSILAPVQGTTTSHELIPARLGAQPVFEPSSYVNQSRPMPFMNTQSVPYVQYHQIPSSIVQNQHDMSDTNVLPRLILPRVSENGYPPMKVLGEDTLKVKLTDNESKFTKVVEFKFLYCPGAGGCFLSEAQLIPYAVDFKRMEGVPFLYFGPSYKFRMQLMQHTDTPGFKMSVKLQLREVYLSIYIENLNYSELYSVERKLNEFMFKLKINGYPAEENILVDNYTNHLTVYYLQNKSDVPKYFSKYRTLVKNQYVSCIRIHYSDRGGEYLNQNGDHG
ncbi:unnamed protein product [Ambrosiozyma monospora]|uniref:Unnamed protein product n=1 Tax=Ambrosiozyma monospora TaxID=43982 RepID=A0A9W7DK82_AMBMO|nr:unnamed protein product [Ambrosiozyma monospora]